MIWASIRNDTVRHTVLVSDIDKYSKVKTCKDYKKVDYLVDNSIMQLTCPAQPELHLKDVMYV